MATKNADTRQQSTETPVTDTRDAFAALYARAKEAAGWDDFIGNEEKAEYARLKTHLWITGARISHNDRFDTDYLEMMVRFEHGVTGVWGGIHLAGPNAEFAKMLEGWFADGNPPLGPVVAVEREYSNDKSGKTQTFAAYSFRPASASDKPEPARASVAKPADGDDIPF